MSREDLPWALKGVSDEIRAAAREAAERTGQTVGEWLSQIIRATEAEERHMDRSREADAPEPADATLRDEVARLERRITELEQRTDAAITDLLQRINTLQSDGSDRE